MTPVLLGLEATAERIREYLENEKLSRTMAVRNAIEAGKLLVEVRPCFQHGEWQEFLDTLGIRREDAWRRMELAKTGLTPSQVRELGGIKKALKAHGVNLQKSTPNVGRANISDPADAEEMAADVDDELPDEWEGQQPDPEPEPADHGPDVADVDEALADVPERMETPVKPPTKLELAEVENAELRRQIDDASLEIESLRRQVRHFEDTASPDAMTRTQELRHLVEELNAARASTNDWMMRFRDLQQAHRGALRRIRQLEGG